MPILPKSTPGSKRAKLLVALCESKPSPTTSESSPKSSCFTLSPVPSWWDNIFEAADVVQPTQISPCKDYVNAAKRKLFSSPVKGYISEEATASALEVLSTHKENIPEECAATASQISSPNDSIPLEAPTTAFELPDIRKCDKCESGIAEVPTVLCETATLNTTEEIRKQSEAKDPAEVPVTVEKCVNSSEKTSQVLKYPSQIKIMVARSALNAGKEHLTVKGKVKKARDPKPSCNDSCRRCTRPKLTHSERLEINCAFWALKEHVKQWTFIQNSVSSVAPKMKTSASGVKGGKLSSRTYYFSVCGIRKRVCKTMFRNTLNICDSWVDSALSHFSNGKMACDKRGKRRSL